MVRGVSPPGNNDARAIFRMPVTSDAWRIQDMSNPAESDTHHAHEQHCCSVQQRTDRGYQLLVEDIRRTVNQTPRSEDQNTYPRYAPSDSKTLRPTGRVGGTIGANVIPVFRRAFGHYHNSWILLDVYHVAKPPSTSPTAKPAAVPTPGTTEPVAAPIAAVVPFDARNAPTMPTNGSGALGHHRLGGIHASLDVVDDRRNGAYCSGSRVHSTCDVACDIVARGHCRVGQEFLGSSGHCADGRRCDGRWPVRPPGELAVLVLHDLPRRRGIPGCFEYRNGSGEAIGSFRRGSRRLFESAGDGVGQFRCFVFEADAGLCDGFARQRRREDVDLVGGVDGAVVVHGEPGLFGAAHDRQEVQAGAFDEPRAGAVRLSDLQECFGDGAAQRAFADHSRGGGTCGVAGPSLGEHILLGEQTFHAVVECVDEHVEVVGGDSQRVGIPGPDRSDSRSHPC